MFDDLVFAPYKADPSDLSVKDVDVLAHALAETMLRLEHNQLHHRGLRQDLAYSVNPWASGPCEDFFDKLVAEYEKQQQTFDPNAEWVRG